MNSTKAYKIISKKTNKPISRGYKGKASWRVWPTEAISNLSNPEEYYVQEYDLVEGKKFDLTRKELEVNSVQIIDVFKITGRGTVISGNLEGDVSAGNKISIGGENYTITGVERFSRSAAVGILIRAHDTSDEAILKLKEEIRKYIGTKAIITTA